MTLSDAKRICNAHELCEECPLCYYEKLACVLAIKPPIDYDILGIEKKCSKWLKEHPEPIYPTYYNWLTSEGVINCLGDRISPEFAEKYGIKPIEDASNVVE